MRPTNDFGKSLRSVFRGFMKLAEANFVYFIFSLPFLAWVYIYANGYMNTGEDITDYLPGINYYAVLLLQMPTAFFYVLAYISAAIRGPLSMGMAYMTKSMSEGEKVSIVDMFSKSAHNFIHGIVFSTCETVVLLAYIAGVFRGLNLEAGNIIESMTAFKWLAVILLVFLSLMRPYLYLGEVTVKLGLWETVKNAARFAANNIVKNLLSFLIVCIFWFISVYFIPIISLITLPFIIYSFQWMCSSALCYPTVKKHFETK